MNRQEENEEGVKRVVTFIVGLLIGGLLVWVFSGPSIETAPSTPGEKSNNDKAIDACLAHNGIPLFEFDRLKDCKKI